MEKGSKGWIVRALFAAVVVVALAGCSREDKDPTRRVTDRLLASAFELSDEIHAAIPRHVEAEVKLRSCEKRPPNQLQLLQCAELKVQLARATAYLCGLRAQRAALFAAIEKQGDARGLMIQLGVNCQDDKAFSSTAFRMHLSAVEPQE